jgi:predicted phosphodiesterase
MSAMKMLFHISLIFLLSCAATPKQNYTASIESNPMKLCFIGDVGIDSPAQLKVSEMLLKETCDSIHFLGDIIYERGLKNHHDKNFIHKFWKYYEKITLTGKKPNLYMVMGNHDHKRSIDAWKKLSEKHPKIFFPHPYYFLKINDVCMTHIETDYFLMISNFASMMTELNWLKSLDLKDCRIKIALGHHPYNSSGKDHGNSGFPLRNILKNHVIGKYDFYISGHEHILSDEGLDSETRLIISGAGGKVDPGYQNGFVVLTISENNKPVYEFKKLD